MEILANNLIFVVGGVSTCVVLLFLIWRFKGVLVRNRDVKLAKIKSPSLPSVSFIKTMRIPLPKFRVDLSGLKGIAVAVLVVGSAMGVAMFVTIVATDTTPEWPDPGAAYALGSPGGTNGVLLGPDSQTPLQKSQTLEVRLANGTRLSSLTATLDMGKAGSDCVAIERGAGNTTGYLWASTVSLDGIVAPTLTLDTSEIHNLTLSGTTDGHTTSLTQATTAAQVSVDSSYNSGVYTATGKVDRFLITLLGDAYVTDLTITGKCSAGPVDLDFIKAGTMSLTNVLIGDDGNVATAAMVIGNTTFVYNPTDNLVDKPVIVK